MSREPSTRRLQQEGIPPALRGGASKDYEQELIDENTTASGDETFMVEGTLGRHSHRRQGRRDQVQIDMAGQGRPSWTG